MKRGAGDSEFRRLLEHFAASFASHEGHPNFLFTMATDAMDVNTTVTSTQIAATSTLTNAQVWMSMLNRMYPASPASARDTDGESQRTLQYSIHEEGSTAPAALNTGQV